MRARLNPAHSISNPVPPQNSARLKVAAYCTSYYHLAQVAGLCEYLRDNGTTPDLTIYRGRFLGAARIDDAAINLGALNYPARFSDCGEPNLAALPYAVIKLLLRSLHSTSKSSVLVNPEGPNLKFLSSLTSMEDQPEAFFSIEDGVGTYGSVGHRIRAKARESHSPAVKFLAGEILKTTILKLVTLRSGGRCQTLMTGKTDGPRITITPYVRSGFSCGLFNDIGISLSKPTALYISQPCVELGLLDENQYREILSRIREVFAKQGIDFLIKPHPSESTSKFSEFTICTNNCPAEALLSAHQDYLTCVVGTTSTSLIVAKRLFGIRAYAVHHPLLESKRRKQKDGPIAQMLNEDTIPIFI